MKARKTAIWSLLKLLMGRSLGFSWGRHVAFSPSQEKIPRPLVVNLIPYNPTSVDAEYQPSTPEDVVAFQKILREGHGIHTTVRQEMGQDINGACGQLVVETGAASEISARRDGIGGMPGPPRVRDIEEMCGA
eukprot:jgi/Mesen1/7165/ME000037S06533